ncbi:hypothetical protein LCGC14_3117340, partial [marine sediment metagenome]
RTGGSGFSSWPSPKATERGNCPSERDRKSPDLGTEAADWPRPQSHDTVQGKTGRQERHGTQHGCRNLTDEVQDWATPNVPNGGRVNPPGTSETGIAPDGTKKQIGLENQASDWPTPRAADSHGAGYQRDRGTKGLERLSLTGQAREWPTPNTGDGTRGRQEPDGKRDLLLDTESRDFARSHQGRETTELGQRCLDGVPGSPQRSRLRRLNPYFVEWLMGWPIDWLELTSFESSEMVSSQIKRRSLSMSSPNV